MQNATIKHTMVLTKVLIIAINPSLTGSVLPVEPNKIAAVPRPDSLAKIARAHAKAHCLLHRKTNKATYKGCGMESAGKNKMKRVKNFAVMVAKNNKG